MGTQTGHTCTTSSGVRLGEYRQLHIAERYGFNISGETDPQVFCFTPGMNVIHQTDGQCASIARDAHGGIIRAMSVSRNAEVSLANGPAGFFRLFALPCWSLRRGCCFRLRSWHLARGLRMNRRQGSAAKEEREGDVLKWLDHSLPLFHSSRPLLHVSSTDPTFKIPVCTGPYSLMVTS